MSEHLDELARYRGTTGTMKTPQIDLEKLRNDPQVKRLVAEERLRQAVHSWSVEDLDRMSDLIERGILKFANPEPPNPV